MREAIDITFDFRSDTPPGRDPDTSSPTLRSYHRALWSKHLPSGEQFNLDDNFAASPLPQTLDAYLTYRERAMHFIDERNHRIAAFVDAVERA